MNDFTKGNVTKQIILFSIPMLLGNVFQQLYSMVDAMIVGRFVGGNALAAVGSTGPALNFLLAIIFGLSTGASVAISQYYGATQYEKLKRTVSTSLLFLVVLVILVSVFGYIFAPAFLRILNTPIDIMKDATAYLRIMMMGLILMLYYNLFTAYLRALGDAKNPLYFLIAASLLNVVLDIILVRNFNLGVEGAAYATIISQALAAVLCFIYIKKNVPMLDMNFKNLVFDSKLFIVILKYSIPAAIQLSVVSLASLTIQRLVNSFGPNTIAGFTAATKIDSFATMPVSSISMAISTFVAQNMGANQMVRAKKGFRSAMVLSLGYALLVSIAAVIFGRLLIGIFVGEGMNEILNVGVEYLSVMAIFYFLFAIFFSFNGFFRGSGDAVIVMILTITSLTIRSVCAHVLVYQFGFGPISIAWSIPIGWAFCSILCFIYYRLNLWRGKIAVNN